MNGSHRILANLRSAWRWVPELEVVLALFVVIGGIWVFAEVADEVLEATTLDFDRTILRAMRNPDDLNDPRGPRWIEVVASDITALGGFTVIVLVVVAVAIYLTLSGQRHAARLIAIASLLGVGLTHLLKAYFDRGRPDIVPHLEEVTTPGFPSGHTMMSAVVYLTLGALLAQFSPLRRVKVYCIGVGVAATMLVGVSRVYLGVHYPTDVLAGWAMGFAWAAGVWLAAWAIRRRRMKREAVSVPAG